MAYAVANDVRVRIPFRAAVVAEPPTDTTVDDWLADAEAKLNNTMLAAGLPAPYTSSSAVRICKTWVLLYGEGRMRQAYAAAGGDGNNDDGKDLLDQFEELLVDILENPSTYGAILGAGSAPTASIRMRSYVTDNADDKSVSNGDFAPRFTKDDEI